MSARHCIVIGAGTVGSSIAWHLTREGHRVTLVSRDLPGQATSFGNAACISPSHVMPFSYPGVWKRLPGWLLNPMGPMTVRWKHLPWVAPWLWQFWRRGNWEQVRHTATAQKLLMDRARDDFALTLEQTGLSHYLRDKGLIVVYDSPEEFKRDKWEYDLKEEMGFAWEHLGPGELKIMVPAMDLKQGLALYIPSWQHTVDPARMTEGLAEASFSAGAQWVNEDVTKVRADDKGATVSTSNGQEITGDCLVVAAGPWSNSIAGQLDRTVPLTAKRGYHAMIGDPGIDLDYPILSGSRVFVITPLTEGVRLAGTAEFARLDAEPNYERARVLQEHARYYLPDLQCRDVTEWMGQRPMMVDSLPIISASPRHSNVFYAFGHGHYGLTQGPTTGMLIADLVAGREPRVDLAAFRFDRF
jgi:D-amino-acid dehydrogenase